MNVSQSFFAEIDKIAKREVSAEVMERARRSLLDYLAVTCAGAAFQKEKLNRYFDFSQPEKGDFKVIGTAKKLVLKEAVFINGLNAHASIEDLLKAAIVGYEASYTLAVSIQPKHKALGYHATGTCGTIGATLAAAYMLGFSEEERYQAFATACVSASGMLKVLDDGSELKPYNVAKTALLSLTSLQLAKSGFKGHADPLGGYRGFLKMMSGDENTEIKPTLLNGTYAIMKSYTKPYASCRYTHPPVEAAIHLRNQFGLKPEDVERMKVETYNLAVSGHDHTDIKGAYSAKMSTPYSVAVALSYGKAGLQEFGEEVLENEVIKALTKKVQVVADEEMSRIFPDKQSAVLTIQTSDNTYSERVDFPKGEPENPMTETEFRERYEALMAFGEIEKEVYTAIYDLINKPETKAEELIQNL